MNGCQIADSKNPLAQGEAGRRGPRQGRARASERKAPQSEFRVRSHLAYTERTFLQKPSKLGGARFCQDSRQTARLARDRHKIVWHFTASSHNRWFPDSRLARVLTKPDQRTGCLSVVSLAP